MAAALLCACTVTKPAVANRVITPTTPSVTSSIEVHTHLPDSIDRSKWLFAHVETQPVAAKAGLNLETGRLSGFTGCNRLSGGYQRQDTALQFNRIAMTRMFCAETSAQESRITSALEKTRFAMIVKANGYLVLLDENRKILAELKPDTF